MFSRRTCNLLQQQSVVMRPSKGAAETVQVRGELDRQCRSTGPTAAVVRQIVASMCASSGELPKLSSVECKRKRVEQLD